MLGWFKKAFGKKTEEPVVAEVPVEEQAPAVSAGATADMAPAATPVTESASVAEEPAEALSKEETEPAPSIAVASEDEPETEQSAMSAVPAVEEPPASVEPEVVAGEAKPGADKEPAPVTPEPVAEAVIEESAAVVPEEPADIAEESPVESPESGIAAPEESVIEETVTEVPLSEEPAAEESEEDSVLPAAPLAEQNQEKPSSPSLFKRLRDRLGKTRDAFIYRLDRVFLGKKEIDQDLFEQLEEVLITADLGVNTTLELLDRARKRVKRGQLSDPLALKALIREEILGYIQASDQPAELVMPEEGPFVIMVVGVNGVGKTTTIGKIAAKFVRAGRSVLLVAGDTFRAAAINQLRIWGERVGTEVIAQQPGADPSSVVYDGLEYGIAHHYDVILIDTAGRLHTSVNLMEELKKIKRVIGKKLPGAPHELMLVLDATTGQNGIAQAKMFHEAVGVTGLAMTKLDGTAKGGIVANVCRELGIPVRFIGIGEQIDDLRDFDAREFVDALFAESRH